MRFAAIGPLAIGGAALLIGAGCTPSGTRPASSFTALDPAMKQARTWVDTTVERTFPADFERRSHTPGSQTCSSDAFHEDSYYQVVVEVPEGEVDRYTIDAWRHFEQHGFRPTVDQRAVPATDLRPPSSGSPSWSEFAGNDGFKGEISGNRVDSSIRISINTPCFDTRT